MKKLKFIIPFLAIALLLAYALPVKTEFAYINDVTGSRKGWTIWFGTIKTLEWYKTTILEDYAMSIDYPYQDFWVSYRGTGMTLFNKRVSFGHGRPAMRGHSPETINQLASDLTDEEKLSLLESFKDKAEDGSKQPLASSHRGLF